MKTPSNPSRKAISRVKNPLPIPTKCPHCQSNVRVAHHQEIYARSYGDWPWVYCCNGCAAYVGMHPFTDIPLGTLATAEIRHARKACKAPFELLYKTGKLTRDEAYHRLAHKLGIKHEECHFGWFDVEMCQRAAQAAREILDNIHNERVHGFQERVK